MPLIGYARVSTEDQTPLPQSQALKSAGCAEIHEEQASGGNRARPVLARRSSLVGPNVTRTGPIIKHVFEACRAPGSGG